MHHRSPTHTFVTARDFTPLQQSSHNPYKRITQFAHRQHCSPNSHCRRRKTTLNLLQGKAPKMAYKHEDLPPPLDSTSSPPPLFDGTTRLYISYTCPFVQRVWITRNYKGLQDKIKLVPINLQNRPAWYKEKVYPENKVPSLEHNGKVIGESLDLIKYVDSNFEGPSLFPTDPERKKFGEELITYTDTFTRALYSSFKGDAAKEADAQFDYLENALKKFDDGPFFLGQFSLVDIAYIPFVERFQVFLSEVFKYDITAGRPKLAAWFEEINKIEAYKVTKTDPKELVEFYKKRFLDQQ